MSNYYNWCLKLKENWQSKDVEQIMELFDEKVEYYEIPTMKINTIQEIKQMWEEIESQSTDNIEFSIICQNEDCCIVNFILKDKVSYDMIYQIKLNDKSKCIFLKQWYMEM